MAAVGRGAVFQKVVFSESRCTNHIPRSFVLTDRNRCLGGGGTSELGRDANGFNRDIPVHAALASALTV
jgi:hypothetical protein